MLAGQGKRAYNKAKANLPAFTFTGTFTPSRLNPTCSASGIMHGDLDHVETGGCQACIAAIHAPRMSLVRAATASSQVSTSRWWPTMPGTSTSGRC